MPRQVPTKRVKMSTIMGRADFIMGMRDAASGKPIRDQWESRTNAGVGSEQWSYERGRMFWVWLKSKGMHETPIKQGRTICDWAKREFITAYRERAIL
jgi:hypothetical protein